MASKFNRFTEDARRVLSFANEEAVVLNHNYIGTEHLLLGLLRSTGIAADVLSDFGLGLSKVRQAVENIVGRSTTAALGRIALTSGTKRVIELAVEQARRLNLYYIGTEHLLLGITLEPNSVAVKVLTSLGITIKKLRRCTEHMIATKQETTNSDEAPKAPYSPTGLRAAEAIHTDEAPKAVGPYSQAVRVGDLVFTAGQIAIDPTTNQFIGGQMAQQTWQVLMNLSVVLSAAGSSLNQVVKTTVFLTNMDNYAAMNSVYSNFFTHTKPARSTVAVAQLPLDALVEIECIAVIR